MTTKLLSPSPPSPLPQAGEGGEPLRASARISFTLGEGGSEGSHFARLRWRCRRGLLELDVVLQEFLARRFAALPAPEQAAFERLLATPDTELLAYLNLQAEPADPELRKIVTKIRQ